MWTILFLILFPQSGKNLAFLGVRVSADVVGSGGMVLCYGISPMSLMANSTTWHTSPPQHEALKERQVAAVPGKKNYFPAFVVLIFADHP